MDYGVLKSPFIHHSRIEYKEPDPELDDVVIYDVDDKDVARNNLDV